jgi:hypothetical protein
MSDGWNELERQARHWAAEQIGRLTEALRSAAPAIEEAAERAAEFLRQELPAIQEALTDLADRVRAEPPAHGRLELPAPSPLAEEDEARKGIAQIEDYLKDR